MSELDIRAVHSSLEEQSAFYLLLCPRRAEIADIIIPWLGLPSCIHLLTLHTSHEGLLHQCFSLPLPAPIIALLSLEDIPRLRGIFGGFRARDQHFSSFGMHPNTSKCWCSHLQVTFTIISGRGVFHFYRASNEASIPFSSISWIERTWIVSNPYI